MPRHETQDLERIHLWIYKRDRERLDAIFGPTTGLSKPVRQIIHDYLNNIEARARAKARSKEA